MIAAIMLILAAWCALAIVLSGIGLATRRLLRLDSAVSLSTTFWMGWATTITLLQPWHLLRPIDGACTGLIVVLGLLSFALLPHDRAAWWRRARVNAPWIAATAVVAVWLADRALLAPVNGDSYLYHLPAVDWAKSYAAVPGLGNLHGRLAFNNSTTLFQALVDHGPLAGRGVHVAHGLLVLPLFARGIRAVGLLVRGQSTARDRLDAILLAAAVDLALGANLSSASPDLPAYVLEAVLASELLGGADVRVLALLSAVLLTVKLSAAGFVLGIVLVILLQRRHVGWLPFAIGAALVLPWLARGLILSGYPAYPSVVGGLPVDWRIPTATAIDEANLVRAWGRRPGVPWQQVLGGWDWVGPWLRSTLLMNRDVVVPAGLGLTTLLVAALRGRRWIGSAWLMLLPVSVELAWWFVTSPDPRFAGACFWLLAAQGIVIAAGDPDRVASWGLALLTLVLAVWPIAEAPRAAWVQANGFEDPPAEAFRAFHTRSGLELSVPIRRLNCWHASLLCTPWPNELLRLRRPADLASGLSVQPP